MKMDNSAISLLYCKRRFQLTVIEGRKPEAGPPMRFGSAAHKVFEHKSKGLSTDDALQQVFPLFPDVDPGKLISATSQVSALKMPEPIMLPSGPAVEVKFSWPYKIVNSYQIDLCGTMDLIYLDTATDILVFRDYKTSAAGTSYQQKKTLGQYALSFQLPFYVYNMKYSGILPASYKEYLLADRYRTELLFIFHNANPMEITALKHGPFPQDFIDREVPAIIDQKLQEATTIASLQTTAPHDGMCVYGVCYDCPFRPACLEMGTEREIDYLRRFHQEEYNPLTFR